MPTCIYIPMCTIASRTQQLYLLTTIDSKKNIPGQHDPLWLTELKFITRV